MYRFSPNENFYCIVSRVAINFGQPQFYVVKGLLIGEVKYYEYSMRSSVIRASN